MAFFQSLLLLGTKPQNKLEESLLAFLKGRIEPPQFEAALMTARVVILVKDPPQEGTQSGQQLRPMVLDGADGRPALCIFTHTDRALSLQKRAPEYAYAMETEFSAVLRLTPAGFGMVFNPGTLFSTEVVVEGV